MQIVALIPIVKGLPRDELIYFSAKKVSVGDIVTVAILSREIRAVVVAVQDAQQAKSLIKTGDFPLKKILKVEKGFLPASLIQVAKETAEYYVTTVSKVLGAVLPKNVLAEAEGTKVKAPSPSGRAGGEVYLEGTQADRWKWISKNILRKAQTVLYVSPSNHELAQAREFFKTDEVEPRWLMCASPEYGFVWLPHVDVIILDHASSAGYHDNSSAKIDFKTVYELHARTNNQQIIFADSLLDLKYFAQDSPVYLLSPWPKVTVVKKEKKFDHASWLVSKDATTLVEKTLLIGGQMYFFAPRKSVASLTSCRDCGEIVRCEQCKRPMALAKKGNKRVFVCPQCKAETSTEIKCVNCDSWKLDLLGVTVDSIADELERVFPAAHILRVSSDVTKTKTQLVKVIEQFYTTPGALLVGTELAIPYLEQPISHSVISSIDSFLSGRSLSGTDKAARIIFDVAEIASGKVLVETSDPSQQFFGDIDVGGLTSAFSGGETSDALKNYRERELAERKKFNYPPYSLIINIGVETHFVKPEHWPDEKLSEQIRTLPKGISYEIDADRAV